MSRASRLEQLNFGVLVRLRILAADRFGRMLPKAEGAEAIRIGLRELSSFVRVHLVTELARLPRPFSVVFQAEAWESD